MDLLVICFSRSRGAGAGFKSCQWACMTCDSPTYFAFMDLINHETKKTQLNTCNAFSVWSSYLVIWLKKKHKNIKPRLYIFFCNLCSTCANVYFLSDFHQVSIKFAYFSEGTTVNIVFWLLLMTNLTNILNFFQASLISVKILFSYFKVLVRGIIELKVCFSTPFFTQLGTLRSQTLCTWWELEAFIEDGICRSEYLEGFDLFLGPSFSWTCLFSTTDAPLVCAV